MDTHTAHLILYSVTAVAFLVWIAGLQFLLAAAREPARELRTDEHLDVGSLNAPRQDRSLPIQGTADVDGEPEVLAARAVSILAKGSVAQIGPVRIVDRTVDSIIFDGDGASSGLGRIIRQGAIHFARLDRDKTRVDFALDVPRGKELLLGGAIFQMLGLAAIAAGFWLLRTYVADAPNPGVRAQTVQMIQVCHLLWPPFLFAALYRKRLASLRAAMETFIRNLPFCEP